MGLHPAHAGRLLLMLDGDNSGSSAVGGEKRATHNKVPTLTRSLGRRRRPFLKPAACMQPREKLLAVPVMFRILSL